MAFGDVYGYKTNSRFVAATAESDVRQDENGRNVVDLVLHGFANGRRNNCPVVAAGDVETERTAEDGTTPAPAFADIPNNVAMTPGDVATFIEGTEPGVTTGASPTGVYSGGVSDQAGGAIA